MNASKRVIHLHIPSELGYEKVAMATVTAVATRAGISAERIDDLRTAVAEACINAIEYGNGSKAEAPVTITVFPVMRATLLPPGPSLPPRV